MDDDGGSGDASLGGKDSGPAGSDSSSGDSTRPADSGVLGDTGGPDSGGSTESGGPVDSGGAHDGGVDAGSSSTFPFRPAFIIGADISYTLQDEAAGATYSDGTSVKPLEEIMANNGFNFIRLRTFVEPSASDGYAPGSADIAGAPGEGTATGGWCSTAATVQMAQRVKRCGMGLFVDFHMRDTWASLGSQGTPSSWVGLSTTPEGPVSRARTRTTFFRPPTTTSRG